MTASTEKLLERYKNQDIDTKYRAELDAALVREDALLRVPVGQGCDSPVALVGIDLDDPLLIGYAEHCPLATARINRAASSPQEVLNPSDAPRPVDGGPGIEGYNARRIAVALQKYGKSLAALANAKTPQELGESFGSAANSLLALRTAAASLSSPEAGLSEKSQARVDAGRDLLGTALTEFIEAKRYRLLANIVVSTDPVIEEVARAMAAWYYPDYLDSAEALQKALRDSERAAENAAFAQTPGRKSALEQMRKHHDDLVALETAAEWKVFLGIASAHREMRKSFEEPRDIDQLTEANQRIQALVDKVAAYVKATQRKS